MWLFEFLWWKIHGFNCQKSMKDSENVIVTYWLKEFGGWNRFCSRVLLSPIDQCWKTLKSASERSDGLQGSQQEERYAYWAWRSRYCPYIHFYTYILTECTHTLSQDCGGTMRCPGERFFSEISMQTWKSTLTCERMYMVAHACHPKIFCFCHFLEKKNKNKKFFRVARVGHHTYISRYSNMAMSGKTRRLIRRYRPKRSY